MSKYIHLILARNILEITLMQAQYPSTLTFNHLRNLIDISRLEAVVPAASEGYHFCLKFDLFALCVRVFLYHELTCITLSDLFPRSIFLSPPPFL